MLMVAKILLTLTVLGYALVTIKADFNKTHATNPKWTPHARFHVVWQILSYSGVGLIALYLIWIDGPNPIERLYLAAAISAAIYGAFFAAVLTRPLFGGALYDDNGYQPFKPPVGTAKAGAGTSMSPRLRCLAAIWGAGVAAVLAA